MRKAGGRVRKCSMQVGRARKLLVSFPVCLSLCVRVCRRVGARSVCAYASVCTCARLQGREVMCYVCLCLRSVRMYCWDMGRIA